MTDSMYLELCYGKDNEKKFYEFVAACHLDKKIADVLYGNAEGKWIYVNKNSDMPFAETKNNGIIVEIGRDLPDWQEALKKYFKEHPTITNGKMLTKAQAKKELKPMTIEAIPK